MPGRMPLPNQGRTAVLACSVLLGVLLCAAAPRIARAAAGPGDAVSRWNVIALEAGRQRTFLAQARALAMVHAAMFDAVNGADRRYAPYLVDARAPAHASSDAAAAAAAHTVLVGLYPEQRALLDAALAASLAPIDAHARDAGAVFGRSVGERVLAARAEDGADAAAAYAPRTGPGYYQPTPPAHAPPLAPHWGSVKPFLLLDPASFVPGPPPALDSDAYARAFDEVKRLGSKTSSERLADQTAASAFWTGFAPQLWSSAARQALARRRQLALVDRARVFALLSAAIADAFVVGWATKYKYALWRPITAIRAAAGDGNERTAPDPAWEPLLSTPPFPCYVSAHAITSGAAEQALIEALGTDRVPFTITHPEVGITRSFRSFSAMAAEALEVRIWSGVHFRFSQVDGLEAGRRIGREVATTRLRPLARGDDRAPERAATRSW